MRIKSILIAAAFVATSGVAATAGGFDDEVITPVVPAPPPPAPAGSMGSLGGAAPAIAALLLLGVIAAGSDS